jgi:hypothetical protein
VKRILVDCAFAALIAACFTTTSVAQVTTGRIEGIVRDASGAIIPGASVSVVNNKTQSRSETLSNDQGLFVIASLLPGEYTVTAEAQGFRKAVRTGVLVTVGATTAEQISLEIGQVSESVTVESKTERVQVSDSQIARAVTLRDIEVLPQLGRTPITLAIFQPGVQIDGGNEGFSRVNGTRQGSNNTKLDGIDVNDAVVPRLGLSLTANNTDSVEQFRVVTNGGKAEYGRSAGAQVELITRSGGNQWSGSAFDYLRNTVLHANNFFNNTSGQARPKFIQNIYGFSLGGPIMKEKFFIFGNFQGRRTAQEIIRNRLVPTAEAKTGIFRWRPPGSTAISSFDIARSDPRGKGIEPKVAAILKLMPDPNNFDVGDGLNQGGFRFNNPNGSMEDQFTIRGDYNLTQKLRLFYRHSWQRTSSIDSLNNADATYPGQPQGTQGGHRWGYAFGTDWTFSPRMINEFRFGHQSATVAFNRPGRLPEPMFNTANTVWLNPLNPAFAQGRNSPVNEFTDNVTLIRGTHAFRTGFNYRNTVQEGYNEAGIYPNISFARANGNIPAATIGPSGATIASADRQRFEDLYNNLLGRMDQVTQTFYSDLEKFQAAGTARVRNYIFNEVGIFFQDDWKLHRNLTLNLGVRWEFSSVPYERDTLQGTIDKVDLVSASANIADFTIKRSADWYKNDWNNFAPRVGFAWDPKGDGKTAIRANYSMYYDRIIGATTSLVDGNTPGFAQTGLTFPNSSGTDIRVSDGVPLAPQPAAPVLLLPNNRVNSIVVFDPDLRNGYVHHFSLTIQRELFRNTVVETGYVGTRGVKLFMDVNPNQRKTGGDFLQAFKEIQAFRSTGAAVPASNTLVRLFGSPAAAVTAIGASTFDQGLVGNAADTVDRNNYTRYAAAGISDYYLRNFPQYNQLIVGSNDGRSYYNSFQFSLRRQVGALKFNANYTWSKSLDNISVDGNGFTSPIDNFNLFLNRSYGDANRPHVFNSSFIYTLPIGRNHRLAGNAPGWLDNIIGGWDLGLLTLWESGPNFTVTSGRQTAGTSINTWANYTGDRSIGDVIRRGDGVFWFTPEQISAFTFPAAGEIGTAGRNTFIGPRYFNMDMSLVKRFRVTETHRVSLRAEFYNLFNNANFANPGTNIVTPAAFGKISSTVGNARIMQMALRYDF